MLWRLGGWRVGRKGAFGAPGQRYAGALRLNCMGERWWLWFQRSNGMIQEIFMMGQVLASLFAKTWPSSSNLEPG